MYAGRLCGRCGKGCNAEKPITGFKEEKKKQKKRYGALPCNDCLTELLGGDEKVKELTQKRILSEMGL